MPAASAIWSTLTSLKPTVENSSIPIVLIPSFVVGGATTYPSGRFLAATHTFFAPCVSFCTRCHYSGEPSHSEVPLVTTNSQVGSLIYRLPDGVRPAGGIHVRS